MVDGQVDRHQDGQWGDGAATTASRCRRSARSTHAASDDDDGVGGAHGVAGGEGRPHPHPAPLSGLGPQGEQETEGDAQHGRPVLPHGPAGRGPGRSGQGEGQRHGHGPPPPASSGMKSEDPEGDEVDHHRGHGDHGGHRHHLQSPIMPGADHGHAALGDAELVPEVLDDDPGHSEEGDRPGEERVGVTVHDGDGKPPVGQGPESVQAQRVVVDHADRHADSPDRVGGHPARAGHVDGEDHHRQHRGDDPVSGHRLLDVHRGLDGGGVGSVMPAAAAWVRVPLRGRRNWALRDPTSGPTLGTCIPRSRRRASAGHRRRPAPMASARSLS